MDKEMIETLNERIETLEKENMQLRKKNQKLEKDLAIYGKIACDAIANIKFANSQLDEIIHKNEEKKYAGFQE